MREYLELRVRGKHARRLFRDDEGIRLGPDRNDTRLIVVEVGDNNYKQIARIEREKREIEQKWYYVERLFYDPIFFGWKFVRKYTDAEIQMSCLFNFWSTAYFEPCGEECGTVYDEATGCLVCSAGAKRMGPLYLKNSTIPKGKDFAITIGRENLISNRAAELFDKNNISGIEYGPVILKTRQGELQSSNWYEMVIKNAFATINAQTITGIEPFDFDIENEYVCPNGDTIGLNLLSELYIDSSSLPETDFSLTKQYLGGRKEQSYIPPYRQILISPRVLNLAIEHKLKGWEFEVAHLV